MKNFNEIFDIIQNMQLGELKDEMELIRGREGGDASILRAMLTYEIDKRLERKKPDYEHHIILKNKHGKYEICEKEYGIPVESFAAYETAIKRKRKLDAKYRANQRT